MPGNARKGQWESVMTRTLLISAAATVLFAGAWTVNLICYHPAEDGLNPLAPISLHASWKQ